MVTPVLIAFIVLVVAALAVFVVVRVKGVRSRQASTGLGSMAMSVLPRSSLGKWSVDLAMVLVLSLIAVQAWFGDVLSNMESNLALAFVLKIILIAVSGASFVAGLIGFVKRRGSSGFVLVGMLVTMWLGLITLVAHFFME